MGKKLENATNLYMEGIRDGNAREAVTKYTDSNLCPSLIHPAWWLPILCQSLPGRWHRWYRGFQKVP